MKMRKRKLGHNRYERVDFIAHEGQIGRRMKYEYEGENAYRRIIFAGRQ